MNLFDKVSTGLKGFDQVIDHLRFGDNVVWRVDSISCYKKMADFFIESARKENMPLIYIRFANHEPILDASQGIRTYHMDASKGQDLVLIINIYHRCIFCRGKLPLPPGWYKHGDSVYLQYL